MDVKQLDSIPQVMRDAKGWIYWKRSERDGKTTKPPCDGRGKTVDAHDSKRWKMLKKCFPLPSKVDGIGFVLQSVEGLVGIDLDNCITPEGEVVQWAVEILSRFNECYCEQTPSGRGVHIVCRGSWGGDRRKASLGDGQGIEVYDSKSPRYFTVTGMHMGGLDAVESQEQLDWLAERHLSRPERPQVDVEHRQEEDSLPGRPSTVDRFLMALEKIDPAVQGQGGQGQVLQAGHLSAKFGLLLEEAQQLLWDHFNPLCDPPWESADRRDFEHQVQRGWQFISDSGRFGESSRQSALDSSLEPLPDDKYTRAAEEFIRKFNTGESIVEGEESSPLDKFPHIVDVNDFMRQDFVREWDIDDFFVAQKLTIVAGPDKSLKTSILCDLAFSLATGTKFLNRWEATKPKKVLLISGETTEIDLQDRIRAIALCRKQELPKSGMLFITDEVPLVENQRSLVKFCKWIEATGAECVLLDPLYWGLSEGQSDAIKQSKLLQPLIREVVSKRGCSLYLCHHSHSRMKYGDIMERSDIMFSGIAELCHQWFLINRASRFKPGEPHELIVNSGARAIQPKLFTLDVNEGEDNELWLPQVWTDYEGRPAYREPRAAKSSGDQKADEKVQQIRFVVEGEDRDGFSLERLKQLGCGNRSQSIQKALQSMTESGELESFESEYRGRMTTKWKFTSNGQEDG